MIHTVRLLVGVTAGSFLKSRSRFCSANMISKTILTPIHFRCIDVETALLLSLSIFLLHNTIQSVHKLLFALYMGHYDSFKKSNSFLF